MSACLTPDWGGMSLPAAGMACLMPANPATAAYAFLTIANSNLLIGVRERVPRYVTAMAEGRFLGTINAGVGRASIPSTGEAIH